MGYHNSLNAGLNDDITHFPQWEYTSYIRFTKIQCTLSQFDNVQAGVELISLAVL